QHQLQDRRRPDHLHADRVLRPADGVANRPGAIGAGVVVERLGDFLEHVARRAAHLFDQLPRVALVVAHQGLRDTTRAFHLRLLPRRGVDQFADLAAERVWLALARVAALLGLRLLRLAGVTPLLLVVFPGFRIVAREQSGMFRGLDILEVLVDERWRVGVA